MCLYPRLIKNKRFTATKKNGGAIPKCTDSRMLWVSIGCGNCIECRKQKARAWQVRLHEELKVTNYSYFVTFSFSPESLSFLTDNYNISTCNQVATKAVRLFLERWRKIYHKSLRHWFVTELGHNNTERIHLHGLIFSEFPISTETLENIWSYGNIYVGDYCNARTINYIVKYITKIDDVHKLYKSIVLASKGLGSAYFNTFNAKQNRFNGENTREYYVLPNGSRVNLPIYYRNHIYSEYERALLWTKKLDEQVIYVQGIKVDLKSPEGPTRYMRLLKSKQFENSSLGYGSCKWNLRDYAISYEMLNNLPD